MKCRCLTSVLIALTVLTVISDNVQAWDWITFYPLRAEAVARFDGSYQNSGDDGTNSDTEWQAGVSLAQKGYILDPGIASFSLGIEPVYVGGKIKSKSKSKSTSGDRDGKFLSYFFQLGMLHGTPGPFSFDVSASRTTNFNTVTLGSRYEDITEVKSASVKWKNTAFPMRLIYTERSLQQDYTLGQSGNVSERDELAKNLALSGRSSKMDLLIEHQSLDDRIITRDQDYELDRVTFNHRLHWGSNSQLFSRLNYHDRTGFNENKRLTIDETARIQHSATAYSLSNYAYSSITQDITTNKHSGEFQFVHQLYGNLITTARVLGSSQVSENLDETLWRTGLGVQYQKQDLLFGGNLSVGLEIAYQETDRDSSFGLEEVIDEPYIVPLDGRIILNRRFIINATIIVTSADGTLVYEEGFDYFATALTDDLTQLQTIPGGRISVGDTILVSYKAQTLPSQEFSTNFRQYNLGFNLGWMNFSHYNRVSDDKLLSGFGESFLNDTRDSATLIDFRWRFGEVDTFLGAERRFTKFAEFETTAYTFRQYLTWEGFYDMLWNLSAVESFTETDSLQTDLYTLELSTNWQSRMNLEIRPVLGVWKRIDTGDNISTGQRDDTFITAGFTLRWRYRKVNLILGYRHERRTTNERRSNENRLSFNLRRRF